MELGWRLDTLPVDGHGVVQTDALESLLALAPGPSPEAGGERTALTPGPSPILPGTGGEARGVVAWSA